TETHINDVVLPGLFAFQDVVVDAGLEVDAVGVVAEDILVVQLRLVPAGFGGGVQVGVYAKVPLEGHVGAVGVEEMQWNAAEVGAQAQPVLDVGRELRPRRQPQQQQDQHPGSTGGVPNNIARR